MSQDTTEGHQYWIKQVAGTQGTTPSHLNQQRLPQPPPGTSPFHLLSDFFFAFQQALRSQYVVISFWVLPSLQRLTRWGQHHLRSRVKHQDLNTWPQWATRHTCLADPAWASSTSHFSSWKHQESEISFCSHFFLQKRDQGLQHVVVTTNTFFPSPKDQQTTTHCVQQPCSKDGCSEVLMKQL